MPAKEADSVPLRVSGLTAGYGRTMILHGVDVQVNPGEIVCIAGPNGAGKSTLLKAITGVIPWSAGDVEIHGVPARSGETRDAARDDIAVVPQVSNVFPSLTVHENLAVAVPRGWGRSRRALAIERTYESFGSLGEARGKLGSSLSGGQRQALAFAMAVVREPKLLLLDEPTAALAPTIVRDVFARIAELRRLGLPILLVEQNVRAAMDVADRAYFLENGRNALDGPAAQLRDDPRIRKVYLGAM